MSENIREVTERFTKTKKFPRDNVDLANFFFLSVDFPHYCNK